MVGSRKRIEESDEYISILEASRILGVTVGSIKNWEKSGKLLSDYRTSGGHRRYSRRKIMSLGIGNDGKREDRYIGRKFNDIVVVSRMKNNKNGERVYLCRCFCGREFPVELKSLGGVRNCGCYRVNEGDLGYKRKVMPNGYAYLFIPGHVESLDDGWVPEHRFRMWERLKRKLREDEFIHHRNGILADNRDENLELWVSRMPPVGMRVSDILEASFGFLERYSSMMTEAGFDRLRRILNDNLNDK